MICSFHHRRAFSPEWSSIHVVRDNANGRVAWSVDSTCDLCAGESKVFCVDFCAYSALRIWAESDE
jgi:hypothetical protein